jgi:Lon-like ATP-dependent protease
MYDVAELRGHRRTYVGAMPGKLVQALKQTGSIDPVIVLDEVDKVGSIARSSGSGDVSSALFEVLDPSQNRTFMDYYLDVPVDLSKVLFVCTANCLDTVPGPLLDRMEVIDLSGYDMQEKIAISQKYLLPKVLATSGLSIDRVRLGEDALKTLINGYCREAGVRGLEHAIERIVRKIALNLVSHEKSSQEDSETIEVTAAQISEFMEKPPIPSEVLYPEILPPGVVMGLTWTGLGGSALYVEAVTLPNAIPATVEGSGTSPGTPAQGAGMGGASRIEVTGRLGAVMSESAKIAAAVARKALYQVDFAICSGRSG